MEKRKKSEWEIAASHHRPSDGEKVFVMKCPYCGYFWPLTERFLHDCGPNVTCGGCMKSSLVKLDHWHQIRGRRAS